MPVKELIGLYEVHSSPSRKQSVLSPPAIPNGGGTALPPPSPARFIHRNAIQREENIPPPSSLPQVLTVPIVPIPPTVSESYTLDITEAINSTPSINTSYEASAETSSTTKLIRKEAHRSHIPIPAVEVFARNAAPLHLPKLDRLLASTGPPPFLDRTGKVKAPTMFSPMNELALSGHTIDDLEANAQITPRWRTRAGIFGSAVNFVLGILGSSALASFYSLQGVFNTVQLFALILSTIVPVGGRQLGESWRKLFLGTIPNVLALNFASTLVQSLSFLLGFMAIATGLLYYFYRSTFHYDRYNKTEGLQHMPVEERKWGLVIVTFLLTVVYLPLSTMAVHVLVWSQDLWIVPNPYINATSFPPVVAPLGPTSEFKDPLNFCWTTTMRKNQINFAPVVISLSAIVFVFLTIWFPMSLRRVIRGSTPKIDKYTDLGRLRSTFDKDAEYHRVLARDKNPFAFLYSSFRRNWGMYESTYLFAKLSTLAIVAIIDPNNCVFRSFSRTTLPVVRQVLLLLSTIGFFIAHCIFAPFLDPVNNASEWTSRLNYVLTALVALAVAANMPGKAILDTYILYSIYICTYGLAIYFLLINLTVTQHIIKRLTRRIDFSIDIFSPHMDISASSPHTKRRIWQESITVLFLTDPACRIPEKQRMVFAEARDSEFPPYLLGFCGTPGERHVENLKILREVGTLSFHKAVALIYGPDQAHFRRLERQIQEHYIGPDSYWRRPGIAQLPGCTHYFGNAWWIPFPPTLVIRYDEGPMAVLRELSEFEEYIAQNSSQRIGRRRQVRLCIRALDGMKVSWPHDHVKSSGARYRFGGRGYSATRTVHFDSAVLNVKRVGHSMYNGIQIGSGFDVELVYSKSVKLVAEDIGLTEDFDLTSPLSHFLHLNRSVIDSKINELEDALGSYRKRLQEVMRWKDQVLTYRFMAHIYDLPRDPSRAGISAIEHERDPRVRAVITSNSDVLQATYDRLAYVSRSEVATWWYIFWDDLWRRNHDTIPGLDLHAADFDPHYPTSIAYTPLPRPALESFLIQRGLLAKPARWKHFFHSGFLNKLYLRLNEAAFKGSSRAIAFHLGKNTQELDMEELDILTQGKPSTLGTGGGTDHDNASIRARPTYRWEALLEDPPSSRNAGQRWIYKVKAWFGLTPLWRNTLPSEGISLDVRLENGRYVIINSY